MNQQHYRDKLREELEASRNKAYFRHITAGVFAGLLLSGRIDWVSPMWLGIGLAIYAGTSLVAFISYSLRSRIYRRPNA